MDEQKTVTVKALQGHSYSGAWYEAGDVYEIASDLVDSVHAQGKAAPVEQAPTPDAPPVTRKVGRG